MGASDASLPSLGGSIAVSLVSLGLVCLAAYLVLRWLSRRGVGQGHGALKVLARLPLEPRRSLYLVEAAGRCFLVGVGDGPMALLAEIDREQLPTLEPGPAVPASRRFAAVLAGALGRDRPGKVAP